MVVRARKIRHGSRQMQFNRSDRFAHRTVKHLLMKGAPYFVTARNLVMLSLPQRIGFNQEGYGTESRKWVNECRTSNQGRPEESVSFLPRMIYIRNSWIKILLMFMAHLYLFATQGIYIQVFLYWLIYLHDSILQQYSDIQHCRIKIKLDVTL